jgi:hypothetical protein
MILSARDPHLLKTLDPQDIACHLKQRGWNLEVTLAHDIAQIWRMVQGDRSYELLLPLDQKLDDFVLRIADVLATLSDVENRTKEDILAAFLIVVPGLTIQGIVTRLQENADSGKVTVMGVVAGRLQRLQMHLPEPAYDLAVKAYQARLPILCEGDLHRQPYGFLLQPVNQFTLDLDAWAAKSA